MARTIGQPVKKIARSKANLEAVVRAKRLLEHAKRERSQREAAWKRSNRQWLGEQWGQEATADGTHDLATVNMSFSTGNTIVPYITGSNPSFIVEPYSGEASPRNARLLQAMLNRHWRSNRMDGDAHLKRAAWNYLIEGDGFLKATYTFDKVFKDGTVTEKEIANLWVDEVDPWDVWIDPRSDGLHNARWCVVRTFMSVADLKADDRYSHTTELAASSEADDDSGRPKPVEDTGSDRDLMVAVYEFYDIANRELVAFTDQVELPLQIVKDIGLPLVVIPNHPIPHSPYSMGELEQILPLQQELNKVRTQMMEHRRRNAAKYVAREGMLSPAAKAALQSERVNEVVEVGGDRPFEDIVKPLEIANLSADVYNVDAIIKQDINEVTGVNEYLRGSTPEIRRTATEATIIEGASNIKTAHKLRQIERAARQIGQLLLDMATDVFPMTETDEMTLILTGKEAQAVAAVDMQGDPNARPSDVDTVRIEPSSELFKGNYEVFVEQGSTELRNPQMREQKYREMTETLVNMAPVLQQLGVTINYQKSFELWFEAAGIDDLDGMFQAPQAPPPPPQVPAPGGGAGGGLPSGMTPEMMQGLPPEVAAQAQAMLAGSGEGQPGPPTDTLGPENTGALPPIG